MISWTVNFLSDVCLYPLSFINREVILITQIRISPSTHASKKYRFGHSRLRAGEDALFFIRARVKMRVHVCVRGLNHFALMREGVRGSNRLIQALSSLPQTVLHEEGSDG